jgi:cytochrome c oxidase cbb3-type subunit III
MAKREVDQVSGVETTGHEWDGIRELDNPLPRWWVLVFYATIIWAFAYWVAMPAWPLLNSYTTGLRGHSDRANVATEVGALQTARAPMFAQLDATPLDQVEANPALHEFAMEAGKAVFSDNCATCHGAGGQGAKGFPSLADDVWLWDGTLDGIVTTLQHGIRSGDDQARFSMMPAYGRDGMFTPAQVADATEFVWSLSKTENVDRAAAARGAQLFAANCVSCHGETGLGDKTMGAPNLRDGEWLYGGTKADISTQIHEGRGGVMPAWSGRMSQSQIRAVAVYVHSLGGGT